MILLVLACVHPGAPDMFPRPLPDIHPEPAPRFEAAVDECPEARPLLPGQLPPFVQMDAGRPVASCRAQVVPESKIFELVNASDGAVYWERVARACYDRSLQDRAYAQAQANAWYATNSEARAEASIWRVAAPVAFVGGVAIGLGAGLTAMSVAR